MFHMLSQFVEFMTSLTLHLSKVTPWNTELTWSASSPLFTSCEISTSDVVVHFLLSVPKIEETLTICSLLAFSYWKRAFERWLVRSRISFLSTPGWTCGGGSYGLPYSTKLAILYSNTFLVLSLIVL